MSSQAQQQQENKKGRAWWGVFSKRAQKPELEQEVTTPIDNLKLRTNIELQQYPIQETGVVSITCVSGVVCGGD